MKGLFRDWEENASRLFLAQSDSYERNVKNTLKYRNGVEQYIGEILEENGVEIINYYQHKNYPL